MMQQDGELELGEVEAEDWHDIPWHDIPLSPQRIELMDDTIWGEQDVRSMLLNLFDRGMYELGLDYLLFSTLGVLDHLHPSAIEMVLEKLADEGFITYRDRHIEYKE